MNFRVIMALTNLMRFLKNSSSTMMLIVKRRRNQYLHQIERRVRTKKLRESYSESP